MGLANTLIGALLVVGGFTVQNVSIVYWTASPISQFGILLFANIFFPCFFVSLLIGYAVYKRDLSILHVADEPQQRKPWVWGSLQQVAMVTGFLNIANGFLIVYASPSDRTPPLIQAVLQNTGVVFSVPFSIWILGDRKNYLDRLPAIAGTLVAASVAVSILPTIIQGQANDGFSSSTIPWILIYLVGIIPGAAYNTCQQLFLIKSGALKAEVSPELVTRASLRMLFYCNLWQLVSLLVLWWVDLVPWFGASTSLSEFWDNTMYSLSCSVMGPSGVVDGDASSCYSKFSSPQLWSFVFVMGYSVSYIGSAQLNRESATFNMMCAIVTTMLTSAYFLIPGTNPNDGSTPLWSVLVSLVLSMTGLVLWKYWESRTPAEEQFALSASGPGAGESVYDKLLLTGAADSWDGASGAFHDHEGEEEGATLSYHK